MRSESTNEINEIDIEILSLLEKRARLVVEGAKSGGATNSNEKKKWKSLLEKECKERIMRDIASLCDALVRQKRVAFLGPLFSYTHLALREYFGLGVEAVAVGTIQSVFEEVAAGQCDFGVVPVENSTDGRIVDALETFTRTNLQICGEMIIPIHHSLMGKCTRSEI